MAGRHVTVSRAGSSAFEYPLQHHSNGQATTGDNTSGCEIPVNARVPYQSASSSPCGQLYGASRDLKDWRILIFYLSAGLFFATRYCAANRTLSIPQPAIMTEQQVWQHLGLVEEAYIDCWSLMCVNLTYLLSEIYFQWLLTTKFLYTLFANVFSTSRTRRRIRKFRLM